MKSLTYLLAAATLSATLSTTTGAETVAINPAKDNTLIEATGGAVSLGAAWNTYVGRVGSNDNSTRRRGVTMFDIASAIPAGATITSVTLKMRMVQTNAGAKMVSIHRLTADWGEGTSFAYGGAGANATENDATWLHTFYPGQFWSTPGGEFVQEASAGTLVGNIADYYWGSTAAMVADVQSWLDEPRGNFGWVMIGDESTAQTVKKFESRESTVVAYRPVLTIEYEPATSSDPADLNGDGVVDGADLGILLSSWGQAAPGDLDASGVVDGADLGLLLAAWG